MPVGDAGCVMWTGGGWGIVFFLFIACHSQPRSMDTVQICLEVKGCSFDPCLGTGFGRDRLRQCQLETMRMQQRDNWCHMTCRGGMLHLLASGCQSGWAGTKGSGFSALTVSLLQTNEVNLVYFVFVYSSTICMQSVLNQIQTKQYQCGHYA